MNCKLHTLDNQFIKECDYAPIISDNFTGIIHLPREDKSIFFSQWLKDGKLHRLYYPARIWYEKDSSVSYKEYWINGEYFFVKNEKCFKLLCDLMKLKELL